MSYRFGKRSLKKLSKADLKLVLLCQEVIKHIDFGVYESARTLERQRQLYYQGKSELDGISKLSKHQISKENPKSKAIDIFPYEKGHNSFDGSIKSELMFYKLYVEFERASKFLDIPITWGGSWRTFKDLPHIELKG